MEEKKKRGRPLGSKNKPKGTPTPLVEQAQPLQQPSNIIEEISKIPAVNTHDDAICAYAMGAFCAKKYLGELNINETGTRPVYTAGNNPFKEHLGVRVINKEDRYYGVKGMILGYATDDIDKRLAELGGQPGELLLQVVFPNSSGFRVYLASELEPAK